MFLENENDIQLSNFVYIGQSTVSKYIFARGRICEL